MNLSDVIAQAIAGRNVTVNIHTGSGDIRSGTEITVNQIADRAPLYGNCPGCGAALYTVWDVSDGGMCRRCARQLRAENQQRLEAQTRRTLPRRAGNEVIEGEYVVIQPDHETYRNIHCAPLAPHVGAEAERLRREADHAYAEKIARGELWKST